MCTEYITNCAINDDVRELLSSIAKKHGFTKFHLEVTEGIEKGDGYTGIAKNVKICNSNNPNENLNVYVKSAPREECMRELLPIGEIFRKEIYMYNTIFPYFKNLEIGKGLTPSTFMPNFFGSILNDKNEVIILENLKEIGYRMHDCNKSLDNEHIRLAITAYATYHSLSLALRNQQPDVFEKYCLKLDDSFLKVWWNFKDIITHKCTNILKFLNEVESKRLKHFLQNLDSEFKKLVSPPMDEYSVVVHGDCWRNNMLFQYPEDSCNPIDVCIIDYQVARLAPPVLDLAHFFFSNSSEHDIDRCNEYLELYYKILSTHLDKLGCDANKLYPYSIFMKQWKKFAKFSLIVSPVILLAMSGRKNEILDIHEAAKTGLTLSDVFNMDTDNDEDYNRKLKTIICYLAKNDLI